MSRPPLEPHNHSQTYLMLCQSSHNKNSQNSLELGPFSLLKSLKMQKLKEKPKLPLHFLFQA
ncbi:hypothetical protein GmHk_09G025830 [Glycine max]|nr:hypothetical protein GmHk_09G025830 [Glycine max]